MELIAFVDAAVRHYGLDRTGLIGVGYSNGANILASMLFSDATDGARGGSDAPPDPLRAARQSGAH